MITQAALLVCAFFSHPRLLAKTKTGLFRLVPTLIALLVLMSSQQPSVAADTAGSTATGTVTTPGCPNTPPVIAPTGAPCGGESSATQGSTSGSTNAAGDPINIVTGNLFSREVDMPQLPGTLALELVRYYNSDSGRITGSVNVIGLLGRGWKLSYETSLEIHGANLLIRQADGTHLRFARDLFNPVSYLPESVLNGTIRRENSKAGHQYIWTWSNGRQLLFNAQGQLLQILAPTGEFMSLRYDAAGFLIQVTDPQGRQLHLNYPDKHVAARMMKHAVAAQSDLPAFKGVQSIDTPVGRFAYEYGSPAPAGPSGVADTLQQVGEGVLSKGVADPANLDRLDRVANLVRVRYPTHYDSTTAAHAWTDRGVTTSSLSLTYQYEDPRFPTLLTGKTMQGESSDGRQTLRRVASWGYDETGRANLASAGEKSALEQITLSWPRPDQAVLINGLGQKTVYTLGAVIGQPVILEARGPGCAQCGPGNTRFSYDRFGRLSETTHIDANGRPLDGRRVERDAAGRLIQISSVAYQQGKVQSVQWQWRYRYPVNPADKAGSEPVAVSRPSVVPGREVVTRIAYGSTPATYLLPQTVTETGFLPTLDGQRTAGEVSRSVYYDYNQNGQRIRARIETESGAGPIQRTVQTDYDPDSRLPRKTISMDGIITEVIERDSALRPTVIHLTDGGLVRTIRLQNNWRGDPETITVSAALNGQQSGIVQTTRYQYDAGGHLAVLTLPGGAQNRFEYDSAGRVIASILPDGSRIVLQRDAEARLTTLTGYLAGTGKSLASVGVTYDAEGRVAGLHDSLGLVRSVRYTPQGDVSEMRNGLDIATRFIYATTGSLTARTDADGTADSSTTGFEQDVNNRATTITAANGVVTTLRYDDFGRKVAEISPDHGVTLYSHNTAGQILARIDETGVVSRYIYDVQGRLVAYGADKQPSLVQQHYEGQRLTEIVSTIDGNPDHATEKTSYRYDAWGHVIEERRTIVADGDKSGLVSTSTNASATSATALVFITRRSYDSIGRLTSQIEPDGHVLSYRYAQAQDSGFSSSTDMPVAIYFDQQPVVTDIRQSALQGLTSYLHGNGLRETLRRDGRGRTDQITVKFADAPSSLWWQRIKNWFGSVDNADNTQQGSQLFSQQTSQYDAADRLVAIQRREPAVPGAKLSAVTNETYGYDAMNRLTHASVNGVEQAWRYDRNGNRLSSTVGQTGITQVSERDSSVESARYAYAAGSNRLISVSQHQSRANTDRVVQPDELTFYHPSGMPVLTMRLGLRAAHSGLALQLRRIVYGAGHRVRAIYEQGNRLLATYRYDSHGDRIAKTIYGRPSASVLRGAQQMVNTGNVKPVTRYSVYQNHQLSAEADENGVITAHYIYLGIRPVAKIVTTQNRGWRQLFSQPKVYAIHTDQLGTPHTVTDARQQVVWQADVDPFGKASIRYAGQSENGIAPFEMNLRLPGQIYDAETGLHYNVFRDYDPVLGRYTTPDPLKLLGGMNPFAYVGSNPLTHIDPLGLYESDIHYYMTFFLGVAAGLSVSDARFIALAAQDTDQTSDTAPLDPKAAGHWRRLLAYHFTLIPSTIDQATGLIKTGSSTDYGSPPDDNNYKNPQSDQLTRLLNAVTTAQSETNLVDTRCTELQFYGEYLHAFEDTFAHRNSNDYPIGLNLGLGHAAYGHNPDFTYNHYSDSGGNTVALPIIGGTNWDNNEARTLEMEHEVYDKLHNLFPNEKAIMSFDEISEILKKFNATPESELHGFLVINISTSKKAIILQDAFNELSKTSPSIGVIHIIDPTGKLNGDNAFVTSEGMNNRVTYLCQKDRQSLDQKNYAGTILPTASECTNGKLSNQ